MKFNATLPLALVLSVGTAGAVMAQTTATQTPTANPSSGYTQPSTTSGQPQANATQAPSGYGQPPSSAGQTRSATAQTPSSTGQTPPGTARTPSATAQTQQPRPTAAPSMASGTAANGNEQVRYAQYRLHAAGLYDGPQDGVMDPNTRAALARYQEQQGLRRSESLDPSTMASLEGNSQTTSSGSTAPPSAATPSSPPATTNPYAGAMGGSAGKAAAR